MDAGIEPITDRDVVTIIEALAFRRESSGSKTHQDEIDHLMRKLKEHGEQDLLKHDQAFALAIAVIREKLDWWGEAR